MRNSLNRWTSTATILFGVLLAAPTIVSAQANVAAQRGAEITPFVQSTLLSPDWGQTRNLGYTVGVDYTRLLPTIIQPSLEVRYISANGLNVGEHSFTGGFKLGATFRGIHPYVTALAGTGASPLPIPSPGTRPTARSSTRWAPVRNSTSCAAGSSAPTSCNRTGTSTLSGLLPSP